jgi:pimeloyl-ACP methyl ester carboxylesterase
VHGASHHLFLPGWGAPASLYEPGLPLGWDGIDPPRFRDVADLDGYRRWLVRELEARPGRVALGGHSMGAALSLVAAAAVPERIARLVLFSPAGLPLTKPPAASVADFLRQLAGGLYPLRDVASSTREILQAPRAALRSVRLVRALDLSAEMRRVRLAGIPVSVVGCTSDTLVTASSCRRVAALLGADYRELSLPGGHMWMLRAWERLASELALTPRARG